MKAPKNACCGKVRDAEGKLRDCGVPGVPVFVIGSFGRQATYLCGDCIKRTRDKGWEVEYQLQERRADADTAQGS